jgi:DNA-binding NarL/FixJ family response regulator
MRGGRLTPKQREVCDLVVLGWSNKAIATKLGVDTRTVETHRANVYDRMGVNNAVELTRKMLGAEV